MKLTPKGTVSLPEALDATLICLHDLECRIAALEGTPPPPKPTWRGAIERATVLSREGKP